MSIKKPSLTVLFLATLLTLGACGDDSNNVKTGDEGGTGQTRVENYLRGDQFTRLVLEVDYVEGFEPNAASEQALIDKLRPLVDKPDGIEIIRDETIVSRGEEHRWSVAELDELANQTNTLSVGDNTIKMHVLFVDGQYDQDDENSKVLGLAWNNLNITIFKRTVRQGCQSLVGDQMCQSAETSIWAHEVGHVMGLVNNPIPPQSNHHDVEHGAHCNNDECVMYWAYEGQGLFDVLGGALGGDGALSFGPECVQDFQAVREGDVDL